MSGDVDIRALADRLEIQQVLVRYCRGIDRGDADMIRSVYHEGAFDRHGPFVLEDAGPQLAELTVPRLDALQGAAQHHVTNSLVELDGDRAAVESYFLAYQPTMLEDGTESPWMLGGRYLDRFERRDGRWAIAEREVVVDWTREALPTRPWPSAENFAAPGRREADPSHALFSGLSAR